MATRIGHYKVNPAYIRSELAKRNISSLLVAALAGYSDETTFNKQLRQGTVNQKVADVLAKLEIRL